MSGMGRFRYLLPVFAAVGLYLLLSLAVLPLLADHTKLCGSCHATRPAYQTAYGSEHAELGCLACHRSPGAGGAVSSDLRAGSNLYAWVFRLPPRDARVDNDACLKCHDFVLEGVQTTRKIRVKHREIIQAGARCADCHGETGHRLPRIKAAVQQGSMDKCFGCHSQSEALSRCRLCHRSAVDRKPTSRKAMGSVAHDRGWGGARHGAPRSDICPICHDRAYCKKCHEIELPHPRDIWPGEHGKVAKEEGTDRCAGCHTRVFCDDCHSIRMPHPPRYAMNHVDRLVSVPMCLTCHIRSECRACHDTHERHKSRLKAKARTDGRP